MNKIGTPNRVTEIGDLVVRSATSKEECEKYKMSHEWVISLYSYSSNKTDTQRLFGLSDQEFFMWLEIMAKNKSQYRTKINNLGKLK